VHARRSSICDALNAVMLSGTSCRFSTRLRAVTTISSICASCDCAGAAMASAASEVSAAVT
jgi:hypothetical protein